jgi:hypothetical protein
MSFIFMRQDFGHLGLISDPLWLGEVSVRLSRFRSAHLRKHPFQVETLRYAPDSLRPKRGG